MPFLMNIPVNPGVERRSWSCNRNRGIESVGDLDEPFFPMPSTTGLLFFFKDGVETFLEMIDHTGERTSSGTQYRVIILSSRLADPLTEIYYGLI